MSKEQIKYEIKCLTSKFRYCKISNAVEIVWKITTKYEIKYLTARKWYDKISLTAEKSGKQKKTDPWKLNSRNKLTTHSQFMSGLWTVYERPTNAARWKRERVVRRKRFCEAFTLRKYNCKFAGMTRVYQFRKNWRKPENLARYETLT